MNNFLNMHDLMTHLTDGGAITNMDDSCPTCWVSFYEGNLYYPESSTPVENLGDPKNWKPVPVQWLTNYIHKNTKKVDQED